MSCLNQVKDAILAGHSSFPKLETYAELESATCVNPRPGAPGVPTYVYTESGRLVARPPTVQQLADWHYADRFQQKARYVGEYVGLVQARGQRLGLGSGSPLGEVLTIEGGGIGKVPFRPYAAAVGQLERCGRTWRAFEDMRPRPKTWVACVVLKMVGDEDLAEIHLSGPH